MNYKKTLRLLEAGQRKFETLSVLRCGCRSEPRLMMCAGPVWKLRCNRCNTPGPDKPSVVEAVQAWNRGERG